jgi:transcriptional antiterminator RfaH
VDSARPSTGDHGLPNWYVVYSKPQKELRAEFHLRSRGVEVFYPRLQLPSYVDVRRQIVPLFPGYLFVKIVLATQFYNVVWAPGVNRFVGTFGMPTPLDDEVVEFLKDNAQPGGLLPAHSTLVVGQRVEITRGPLAGIIGILQRPPNAKGRIRVLIRLLDRRALNVDVPLHSVNTGWTPSQAGPAVRVRA